MIWQKTNSFSMTIETVNMESFPTCPFWVRFLNLGRHMLNDTAPDEKGKKKEMEKGKHCMTWGHNCQLTLCPTFCRVIGNCDIFFHNNHFEFGLFILILILITVVIIFIRIIIIIIIFILFIFIIIIIVFSIYLS